MNCTHFISLILLSLLAPASALSCSPSPDQPPPQSAPGASPPSATAPADPIPPLNQVTGAENVERIEGGVDPAIENLLDDIERNTLDLSAITADLAYEKEDALLGKKELRTGSLIYRVNQDSTKSFAILFDSLLAAGTKREHKKHYVFSDRWLVEIDHQARQFIKREIVAPGQSFDPLKLGEGPFPLPIGQKKSDVLARFTVQPAPLPDQGLLSKLQNVDGLLLTPRPDTPESADFKSVTIFYDSTTRLPLGIDLIQSNNDRKTVRLDAALRNPSLSSDQLAQLSIADPDPNQWNIDIRPWDDSAHH